MRRPPLVAMLLAAVVFPGCGHAAQRHQPPVPTAPGPAKADRLAVDAATSFLDGYLDPDGCVVRRDQGADTVGEGQAYAMLAAAAIGDQPRFNQVWGWTQANLERPDGLLAFHWAGAAVTDHQAAARTSMRRGRCCSRAVASSAPTARSGRPDRGRSSTRATWTPARSSGWATSPATIATPRLRARAGG